MRYPENSERGDVPDEAYLVAIASLDNVGPATFRWLLSHGSPRRVWERIRTGRLSPGPGARVDRGQIAHWVAQAAGTEPANCWDLCTRLGLDVLTPGSDGYPPDLADDPDPPVLLFRSGRPEVVSTARVAIVGTRRATGYGIEVAHELGRQLTAAGVSIVSGLALGIDAAAHRGAVSALPSPDSDDGVVAGPVAVVGANLQTICPRRNRELAERVRRSGVLYSEVPPDVSSAPWRFPVRNRLVAAMSDAVVVVESAANGGSMHTVREALDRGRGVLAVPGPVGVRSSDGTNQLIRDGAAPCLGVDDVLAELQIHDPTLDDPVEGARTFPADASSGGRVRSLPVGPAAAVLAAIGWSPVTLDGLATSCGLAPRELAVLLTRLESENWIVRNGLWVERVHGG